MASVPHCIVTPRDTDLFQALDRCPLTVRQVLKVSQSFAYPFTTERRVQERLQTLCAAGRVRRWLYATAGQGTLNYFTLSPLGFQLLHGHDAPLPSRHRFGPVGIARQRHTQALAEFVVHTAVAACHAGATLANVTAENALRLQIGEDSLYPDNSFQLILADRRVFRYFLEIDNATERVSSATNLDSLERKIRFYDRFQDLRPERFRVLTVTTGTVARLQHILDLSARLLRNPQRSLVYGICLPPYLAIPDAVSAPCFFDHRGSNVSLLPAKVLVPPPHSLALPRASQAGAHVLASASC